MSSWPAYEFFLALALVLASAIFYLRDRNEETPLAKSAAGYIALLLGAWLSAFWGARVLGEIVDAHSQKRLSWHSFDILILDRASGTFVYYGALLALIYYLFLIARFRKISFEKIFSRAVPALLLGHALGRLGCWFRGCCHGDTCPYPWGVVREVSTLPIHPVQLYESAFLFGFFVWSLRRQKTDSRLSLAGIYLLAYPSFRFLVEFLRGDELRGFWGPLSTSQWVSLALFCGGVFLWKKSRRA